VARIEVLDLIAFINVPRVKSRAGPFSDPFFPFHIFFFFTVPQRCEIRPFMVPPVMFGLLLACFLFTLLGTASSQSVSITDESAFSSQRGCAQGCMGSSNSGPLFLASELSCAQPYDNSCFCRSDLQQKAESYLKSCVNSACTNTLDASSAVSIYDAYCTSAGFVKAAVTTGMPTSSLYTPATVTVTMVETVAVRSGQMRLSSPVEALVELVGLR
jgi:hypothetical protein